MVVGRVALYLLVHDHMGSSLIIGLVKGRLYTCTWIWAASGSQESALVVCAKTRHSSGFVSLLGALCCSVRALCEWCVCVCVKRERKRETGEREREREREKCFIYQERMLHYTVLRCMSSRSQTH